MRLRSGSRLFFSGAASLVLLLMRASAQACTACMGDADSKFAEATNAAIFLMLGLVGGVLGLLSVFAIYLHRRSFAPPPPHVEIAEDVGRAEVANF